MKILSVEGPMVDLTSFQPFMKVTLEMPLEVQKADVSEQAQAWILYQAWTQAWQSWHDKTHEQTP